MLYKFSWLTFILLLETSFSSYCSAESLITMNGSIIETACSIDINSKDQTIEMGSLSISQITQDGQSNARTFSIKLINCVLERPESKKPNWQYFTITFDGVHNGSLFTTNGQAEGIGIEISSTSGEVVYPGKAMSSQELTDGTRNLNYKLRIKRNNKSLKSGNYFGLIKYKLDYE